MNEIFTNIFTFFNVNDELTRIIIYIYLACSFFIVILRIIICVSYQTQYTIFQFTSKELNSKEDFNNFKTGILSKIMKDYVRASEKSISNINTNSIVNKYILRMGLFFWKYNSMGDLIYFYENSQILIGILLAVFLEYSQIFGVTTIFIFLIMRLFATFFDFKLAKERLKEDIIEYVDREVGQFYFQDLSASINNLKSQLISASQLQANSFNTAIEKFSIDLSSYSKTISKEVQLISEQQQVFNNLAQQLKDNHDDMAMYCDSIKKTIDYIEKNQSILSESLNKYELSLETITSKLGESLASIIDFQIKNTYDNINDSLHENLKQSMIQNNELITKLQNIFSTFIEQSKFETTAILDLKEHIENSTHIG